MLALKIFAIHIVLSFVSIVCTLSGNSKIFLFGFNMAGVLIILYPIIGGVVYLIVSLIGMIKSKKTISVSDIPNYFVRYMVDFGSKSR